MCDPGCQPREHGGRSRDALEQCDRVYANVTLSSVASTADVLVLFLMQDKILWVSLTMKTLSDTQTTAVRMIPGWREATLVRRSRPEGKSWST